MNQLLSVQRMNRIYIVILAPAASGLVLLPLVFFNLSQFHSGAIEVQAMLGRELPVVLFGFISCIVISVTALLWFIRKQWKKALYACLSILVFFVSFIISGTSGGAFLNAT